MMEDRCWVGADDLALFTDQYELTMMQAYYAAGMHADATFSLYFREMPTHRNFMLACGQVSAAGLISRLHFPKTSLDGLARLGTFRDDFLRWLEDFRFSGEVMALPEGTPVFPYEPLLEVTAPIAEAQLLETLLMNVVHLETVLASKAARVVRAARGRSVADFGMRRMHGLDAAVQGVRAYRIAGIGGTSNVLAGLHYDSPVLGTMAHSYVEAFDDEADAYKAFAEQYPGTTLLVDTYDTLQAVDKIVGLKRELGEQFDVGAIRLDSGDLGELARAARDKLDAAGLKDIRIVASGGLDEYKIDKLMRGSAPIDAFGVGTSLGTSADAPNLDLSYKLTWYAGKPRLKKAPGKPIYPGAKQVWRYRDARGQVRADEITLRDEKRDGAEALLAPIMTKGEAVMPDAMLDLEQATARARREIDNLPPALREFAPSEAGYDVDISDAVYQLRDEALRQPNE